MGRSFSCKCKEREKPISERAWQVWERNWNTSPFEIAGGVYSDYSTIYCKKCGEAGRSKAKYVDSLPDR